MKSEFQKFMTAPEVSPPHELDAGIRQRIAKDLTIHTGWLLAKLFFLHVLVGAATLGVCPQFNVSLGVNGFGSVLYALMKVHFLLCAAFCGMVFLGTSALVSSLALRDAEVLAIKNKSWWIYPVLAAVSLAFFMAAGSAFQGHYDAIFSLAWMMGGVTAALALTRSVFWLRRHLGLGFSFS